jgi:NTP pyrophosphatase (non-canonical NTP hydrolase)
MRIHLNADKYQELAMRTRSNFDGRDPLVTAALGLAGEGGEFADMIKKWYDQGHPLNHIELADELGDICWYIALAATAMGYTFSEILEGNIDKLQARYPNGFEVEKSLNRD